MPTKLACPYALGSIFNIEISPPQAAPFIAKAKVVHVYSPFTMSSVMRIALTSQSTDMMLPGEAVLKVYDRRFADGIRKEYDIDLPTHEGEARYAGYLQSGNAAHTKDQIDEAAYQLPDDAPELIELGEHMVSILSRSLFESEKAVYSVLSSMQGKYIPTFYGTTRLLGEPLFSFDTDVPGILVEFIPGTNLSHIDPTRIDLHAVCSTAVDIVNCYSDLNVLNRDMRLENFIVKPSGSGVMMIDFGHCRIRREDENDQAWGEAKCIEDEEGAIGYVVQNKFGWNYVKSGRYTVYAETAYIKSEWFNPETRKIEFVYIGC
ncbi:hypothetical protein RSOLAG22IIIB_07259 [Rhizoctonia solani]|uniref:Protein kinase domain-containing protein n=1 Tax=Rhizoctonia solani TaxID=456999 RepID=A0A0K6FM14_9AGAM|nr:hypothetical protein RSOLAG22IIIB_07259 [Rhizoctonia solani]